jgi:UV DNA damage repair endonuclease
MGKIGFACKWIDFPHQTDGIKATDDAKQYNTGTTTISWLNKQTRDVAEQKLWDLCTQNLESTYKLVEKVGTLDNELRMVRLSSDILPAYTHELYRDYYKRADVLALLERGFSKIGVLARDKQIRLSMHPGQFTVLASDNPGIVDRSIEEFEYHADMARFMGYGKKFQDFKINVHIAGKQGPAGIRSAYSKLSTEARNCITIENEENAWGLNDCLELTDILPIVLDIHHHWVREGEYIQADDIRVQRVIDSWRGVRPTCHYSVSREDVLVGHCTNTKPNYTTLLESGHKKAKLRAHSDFYWNKEVNNWAISFANQFDIMCESKGKNLASIELYNQMKGIV